MLEEKIKIFSKDLPHSEREILKSILSFSYTDLYEKGGNEIQDCLNMLSQLQNREGVSNDGIAFIGDSGISTEMFDAINSESKMLEPKSIRFDDHLVSTAGDIGQTFGESKGLLDFVSEYVGEAYSTGKVNYLYYDEEGMGIKPHIDNDEFPLNVILMLDHQGSEYSRSSLRFHLRDGLYKDVFIKPGELIIFFADTVVHERTPLSENEKVRIAAFGFNIL